MSEPTLLGYDTETHAPVHLGDLERTAGTYILGKPMMGKSNLLVNFALHDIEAGYGLFFLDPHGDAIGDILKHRELTRLDEAIVLLTEIEDFAFGINLTQCKNVASLTERINTYTKAYNIFKRAFTEEWGPWLQLIIENTLYIFIENQGYTLAEAPRFLLDAEFRNKLVANMQYNPEVIDFWRYRFSQRRERDQEAQVDAALTRFSTFLGHPYVRDIIGQIQTKVDLARYIRERKIVLLLLSANLASDIKRFIGTIFISELLHAVRDRPIRERHPFSIFVDEFQNFATEDFASLITEGRKFGIATTIAHQERYGQLRENPQVLGATLAAANKIMFQLTVRDAQELAPEFARSVVEATGGREADLVLTPHAVQDIWERGHPSKEIMDIRANYFWIASLARQRPADEDRLKPRDDSLLPPSSSQEYPFDPSRFSGLDFREFPWHRYRTPPTILHQGIEFLNRYYYQQMSEQRGQLFLREVVQSLGGIFGFFPCQGGAFSGSGQRLLEELFLQLINAPQEIDYDGFARAFYPYDYQEWPHPEIPTHEISQSVPPFKIPAVKHSWWEFYDRKGQDLHVQRSAWQARQLVRFLQNVYIHAGTILAHNPIKIPSGKYTEQIKVERTQQDLINEMAVELSDLSPYTAYTKLITNTRGVQQTNKNKIQTRKAPEGKYKIEFPFPDCYTPRQEVHRQIAERLNRIQEPQSTRPPRRSI